MIECDTSIVRVNRSVVSDKAGPKGEGNTLFHCSIVELGGDCLFHCSRRFPGHGQSARVRSFGRGVRRRFVAASAIHHSVFF